MKKLPIYELEINENIDDESEVNFISLVDSPAIEKDFMIFNKQEFINPSKGEHKDEFLPRCIKYVIDEGKESEQAVAICNSLWTEHFAEESYTDYPQAATENAKIALRWAEANGWGDCGTPVGKIRANQLANQEPISRETIARMASFERHRQYSQRQLGDGCGRLMWLAWGGDAGIEWAQRKLSQIDKEMFASLKVSIDYDDTLSTVKGKELAKRLIKEGNTVYIISARHSAEGMYKTADDLGIPHSRVYATGSNNQKIAKVKELGIEKHIDNNADVVKQLKKIGEKFLINEKFDITNEEQRIISGPIMLADSLIYRNSVENGEHYVKFTKDTIKAIAIKFAKKKYQNRINLMHEDDSQVEGVTMFESWITDEKRGILPMVGFEDVANGSWFGSFFVENDDVWEGIKSGIFKGFSVEGLFEMTSEIDTTDEELFEVLKQINKIIAKK
jgi:hypothetical protein